VIGLLQWLVLRKYVQQGRSASLGITLTPTLTFIAVAVLSTALFGVMAGSVSSVGPSENITVGEVVRLFEALALGVVAAGILGGVVLRRQVGWMGWGVLASSVAYSIGFPVGFAIGGPPADFLLGVAMVGLAGGTIQWLALREKVNRAGWWVPANTLGLTVGAVVSLVIVFSSAEAVLGVAFLETDLGFVVVLSIFGAIAGAVGGAITGAVLVRLLRNPITGATEEIVAIDTSQASA
jgi:hypothetical protein